MIVERARTEDVQHERARTERAQELEEAMLCERDIWLAATSTSDGFGALSIKDYIALAIAMPFMAHGALRAARVVRAADTLQESVPFAIFAGDWKWSDAHMGHVESSCGARAKGTVPQRGTLPEGQLEHKRARADHCAISVRYSRK